jgi:hypothetical protein
MEKIYNVLLDTKDDVKNPAFVVNTNDLKTVKINLLINQDGDPIDLTGATVRLAVKKPDKTTVLQDFTVVDALAGSCEIVLNTQAYVIDGKYDAEVMVYYGVDTVAVTGQFSYRAVKGILDDGTVESTNEWQSITQAIADNEALLEDLRTNGTGVDAEARADITTIETSLAEKAKKTVVFLADFNGTDNEVKIQSAIDYAVANGIKTVLMEDKTYIISAKILIKTGIKLVGGYKTSFTVYGVNYNVLEFQKNSSAEGFTINIDDVNFVGNVLYFDGVYRYYNSWNRTAVRNIQIIDWNDYRKATGVKLLSRNANDEISFLVFDNVKIVSMNVGVSLQCTAPTPSGSAYINANRFNNFTIEGCNAMINISSQVTIPAECSGNIFSSLQMQPSYATQTLITVNGGYNVFDGMIWDLQLIPHSNNVIFCTAQSEYTRFNLQNMPYTRVSDLGNQNNAGRLSILENRTTDRTTTIVGQMWFRTDNNTIKVVTSTGIKTITPV